MSDFDLSTIRAMYERGVVIPAEFGGGFCSPIRVEMTPEQMLMFLTHGRDYALTLAGISPAVFDEWSAVDGRALCMERLRNGRLCGNSVAAQCSLTEWQELHRNAYCHLHGG